jgi:hypothetical protein
MLALLNPWQNTENQQRQCNDTFTGWHLRHIYKGCRQVKLALPLKVVVFEVDCGLQPTFQNAVQQTLLVSPHNSVQADNAAFLALDVAALQ